MSNSTVMEMCLEDLEKDVVMMDFNEGFSVDWVRVSSELVDLSIYLLSNVPKEVF